MLPTTLACGLLGLLCHADAPGQALPPCDQGRALQLVRQQLSESKDVESRPKRIALLARAGGLLWQHEEKTARAVFMEAFDLASAHFRERGDEVRTEPARRDGLASGLRVQLPDQRFVVLQAVARKDPAWARELARRVAAETREEAAKGDAAAPERRPVGEKMLTFAAALLETDPQTALAVARGTFADPATLYLPLFLYRLAAMDRAAADALFKEALAAYAARDVGSLLYLSPYPFALSGTIGPVPSSAYTQPPAGFAADPALQRQFAAAFLGLAELRIEALTQQPPAGSSSARGREPEQFYAALRALESLYGRREPAALERIQALAGKALPLLPAERARRLGARPDEGPRESGEGDREARFADEVERAERQPGADARDHLLARAVISAAPSVPLEKVEAAAKKIGDAETRHGVLNWLYFARAQGAAREGALDEARRLAERVEALDERALLFLEIAAEGLRRSDDRARAEELADALSAAARRAPETEAKARALLGATELYARLHYLRAPAVLAEAVKTINRLKEPDLVAASLTRKIQGKDFSTFTSHPMPGFSLEASFRELGARDFEAALSAANALDDKHLRATALLALSAKCLEGPPGRPAGGAKGRGRER